MADASRLRADAWKIKSPPDALAQLDRQAHRPRLVDQERSRPLDPPLGFDLGVGDFFERSANVLREASDLAVFSASNALDANGCLAFGELGP